MAMQTLSLVANAKRAAKRVLGWVAPGALVAFAWAAYSVLVEVPTLDTPTADSAYPLSAPFVVANDTSFSFYGVTSACLLEGVDSPNWTTIKRGTLWNMHGMNLGTLAPGDKGSVSCGSPGLATAANRVIVKLWWKRLRWIPREKVYGYQLTRTHSRNPSWEPLGGTANDYPFPDPPDLDRWREEARQNAPPSLQSLDAGTGVSYVPGAGALVRTAPIVGGD